MRFETFIYYEDCAIITSDLKLSDYEKNIKKIGEALGNRKV